MSNTLTSLVCTSKEQAGTIQCKKIRSEMLEIPAILYGENKPNQMLSLPEKEINLLHNRKKLAGHLFELMIYKKKQAALVKAIQTHHLKGNVLHIDFQRVAKGHKITTNVPILFINAEDSPAVKEKGQIIYTTTEVSVTCLPGDLPEHIELDLAEIAMDQIIHLAELTLPKGVELTEAVSESHNPTLVTAHMPKIIEEPVEETATDENTEGTDEDADAQNSDSGQNESESEQDS